MALTASGVSRILGSAGVLTGASLSDETGKVLDRDGNETDAAGVHVTRSNDDGTDAGGVLIFPVGLTPAAQKDVLTLSLRVLMEAGITAHDAGMHAVAPDHANEPDES